MTIIGLVFIILAMSFEQKLRKVKIFRLQSMSNAIRCINQRFAFKSSGISCLALIFNLSNLRTTILQAKKLLQVATLQVTYCFFPLIDTNLWLSG